MRVELRDAVRAAAQSHALPGGIRWRILPPDAAWEIAADYEVERRAVELAALEDEIVPLHYLRNIARFAIRGQITLLHGSVALVSAGAAARKCLEILAVSGVGEIRIFSPAEAADRDAADLAMLVRNLNASIEVRSGVLELRQGDPASPLRGAALVACCLERASDEVLLQAVGRRVGVPLVCAGAQGARAQATVVLPGDPGVGLVYRSDYPHLDRDRPGSLFGKGRAPAVAGAWVADQCLALLLGHGEVLRGRLLYADLDEGVMETFPLDG
jgi:molybdopterin/thiamine biosynthesis adenylyltransferase